MNIKEIFNKNKNKILKVAIFFAVFIAGFLLSYLPYTQKTKGLIAEQKNLSGENKKLSQELSLCKGDLTDCQARYVRKIDIQSNSEGGFTLYLRGKPFLIRGVGYNPIPIGKGYDYNFFSDKNKPWLIDGQLMKEAGINCIRIYSAGSDIEETKAFIRDMYEKFGIYTLVSDWLGLWDYPRANYSDKDFCEKTKERFLSVVKALKDEEGVLMWILGNENNYTFSGKIGFWTSPEIESLGDPCAKQIRRAEIYYSFVNSLAKDIKAIDPVHPVALGNGEANFLDTAAKVSPDIDIIAVIIYRGKKFGNLFSAVRNAFNRPVLLSEFGCDSYDAYKNQENQDVQAEFLMSQWKNVYENTTLSGNLKGNVLGGCLFEWTDEWWKHNEGYTEGWNTHDTAAGWSHGSYFYDIKAKNNLNMNEEWFGIISISEEKENGINKRLPKKAYHSLREFFDNLSTNGANTE
ncbi:MAG: glycosyl hydrolase [Candidatus Omnitrophica bacterium]|nr:glycosyl hydrolase [Candidatus Omnitrophota bacterium]MDD5429754.1 glycosyl hydrolase [Candidatus Omnitrophota bacterium]